MEQNKPLSNAIRHEQPPGLNSRKNKFSKWLTLLILLFAFAHWGRAQNNCTSATDAFMNSVCIPQTATFGVSQTEY